MPKHCPTREELLAARTKTVRDVIGPGLRVLFVGINPGLYSAAIGHHFGRPGNRFWPALFASGFTPRLFSPHEESELLQHRLGIVNLVDRASARAAELTTEELISGGKKLRRKVQKYQPKCVAILGITSYRTAFGCPRAELGEQSQRLGSARVWVLPNPSGLNAHFQSDDLARLFRELREAVD
jgi:TDG/mug DNA glycosylase family protein